VKESLPPIAKLSVVIIAGLLLVTGCVSTIRLKVVDEKTSQPLAGVSTMWREDVYDLIFGRFQTGPTNLPLSSDSGVITIKGVHKRRVGRFILSHPGYATIYGVYSTGYFDLSKGIRPSPLPQDRFVLEEPTVTVGPSNGCFLVEMPK
jgi:hypothetical protein